jgi:hypothetical protein
VLIDAPKLVIASNTDALLIINVPVSIQHPGSTATPTTEVFRVMGQPLSSNQPAPMVTFTLTNRAERCTVTSEMLYLYLIRRDSAGEGKEGGPTGQGTAVWPDGKVYVGEMKAGHPDGQGTMTWRNGTKYVGDFKEGLANGRGTLTLPDGKVQDGLWKRGQFAGAAE